MWSRAAPGEELALGGLSEGRGLEWGNESKAEIPSSPPALKVAPALSYKEKALFR